MKLTTIEEYKNDYVKVSVKECSFLEDGMDVVDFTVFVTLISGSSPAMFTFKTKPEALHLFKEMLKSNIA
jgi:hypothetical protein